MKQPAGLYDSQVYHDNVYGHAIELLRRQRGRAAEGEVHLDIGCGFGRIAEHIQGEFGRAYVGVDGAQDGLDSLAERGFEAHRIWLEGKEGTVSSLRRVVGERSIASITFLDTIEHLIEGEVILAAIAELARQHNAWVVVSTPNVTHRDIGAKLAFGQWDYTDKGLLDHTHVRLFDDKLFVAFLNNAGLQIVDDFDVRSPDSDQRFPSEHPALATGTPLRELLVGLAEQANQHPVTTQFVRLCASGRQSEAPTFVSDRITPRPFLSVVIRTQGRRLHTLVEVLTCLSGQTDTDFEVVVVGHKVEVDQIKPVERVLADTVDWLREKICIIREEEGDRARPLNVGFAKARGRYISILDDDDLPMAHYVETFRNLDKQRPGTILRSSCVRQDVINVTVNGRTGLRACSEFGKMYTVPFDFFQHLIENLSPPISLAFPRGAFHDLGFRFDEDLTTTEDWDFFLRTAAVCGVVSSPSITGIYRWWVQGESSRSEHAQAEWDNNYQTILRKTEKTAFVLPRGSARDLRRLVAAAAGAVKAAATNGEGRVDWVSAAGQSMPKDLRIMLVQGVRRKIGLLKLKYYIYLPFSVRRRRYRARIREQREVLAKLR
jgi:glycosyltransferase involved in cell wall biosynthesis/2-polyprenyl-3-methyl-5-hydroxy-6-metoxy-1,4-benzoquinol methylase